jgi:photosystem II PsbU protein
MKLMRRLVTFCAVLLLFLSCFGLIWPSQAQASTLNRFTVLSSPILAAERVNPADELLSTEFGKKIDLNNAPLRSFRQYRGFYPSLAKKIVDNAPYEKVEDVLAIPGLSERQKELLESQIGNFTVTPPTDVFNEEANRINPGVY